MEIKMAQYVKVLLPTMELEQAIIPHIESLRDEGFSERHVLEWAIQAWIEVERPRIFGDDYITPKDAVSEIIHDVLIGDRLLCHLSPQEAARVMRDAYYVCTVGYVHFARFLDNYRGLDCTGEVTVQDWFSDSIVLEVAIA